MSNSSAQAQLGDKAKDLLTGFSGVIVARTKWLHGCDRLTLEPDILDEKGQPQKSQVFDEQRIEVQQTGMIPRFEILVSPIELGNKVRDKLNGFQGIVTGRTHWISGLEVFIIEPDTLDDKGQPKESFSVESCRVDLVAPKPVPVSVNSTTTRPGGPQRGESSISRFR